jgi:hypothetical protein
LAKPIGSNDSNAPQRELRSHKVRCAAAQARRPTFSKLLKNSANSPSPRQNKYSPNLATNAIRIWSGTPPLIWAWTPPSFAMVVAPLIYVLASAQLATKKKEKDPF